MGSSLLAIALAVCSVAVIGNSQAGLGPSVLLGGRKAPVLYKSGGENEAAVMSRLRRISQLKQERIRADYKDGKLLVSLAGKAVGAKGGKGDHHWGEWRTPGNSNAYEGMTEPVQNNNPLGDHILNRDLDKDVDVSELDKYDNPLIDALEGKGLPKMFYEDDEFTPCHGDHCKVVDPSNPVSKIHTHWTGNPRGFGYGGQRDLWIKCRDPTSIYYNEACDPDKNHYGRPLRPGGFPDGNQIVDRHLWIKNQHSTNSYAVRWFPFRHNLSASTFDFRPRGMGIPGNNGMMKTPYTGTGYYGGLSGPPFFTEGPRGSEVAPMTHPAPYINFSGVDWDQIGLGDDAIPAQPIVGHEGGVNDMMYRFRWLPCSCAVRFRLSRLSCGLTCVTQVQEHGQERVPKERIARGDGGV